MNAFARTSALSLIVTLVLSSVSAVHAAPQQTLLLNPPQEEPFFLPKFGFRSYNLGGVGEVVTHVKWGSIAWKMGLQKGDIIRSVNHIELSYHGMWNNALRHALLENNGRVHLHIIDRNTGLVAQREVNFGGFGDVAHVVGYGNSNSSYLINDGPSYGGPSYGGECYDDNYGYPTGPVTSKMKVGPQTQIKKQGPNQPLSIGQVVEMFDKD